MGAAFPILVRALTERREELGQKIARLYTWNTMGSVIGCVATGYVLIAFLGVNATIWLSTALNVFVGVLALLLSRRAAGLARARPEAAAVSPGVTGVASSTVRRAALAAMFLSGFASPGYEIVWTRVLTLLSDHSVYTFSALVGVVLIGIALGSLLTATWAARGATPLPALIGAQLGLGLCAVLWFPGVAGFARLVVNLLGRQTPGSVFMGVALILTLLPCLLMGISFPLALQVYAREVERTGQSVGEAYSINLLGAMLGSVAAGFFLIPVLGSQRSLLFLALANLAAALGLSAASHRRAGSLAGLGGLALVAAVFTFAPNTLYQSLFNCLYPDHRVMHVFESVEGTVTVAEYDGDRYIYTNGVHDADTSAKMLGVHRMIGYLPMFVRPAPANPLVVGLGGGATSSAVAQKARGEVKVVELSAGMVAAARTFSDANWNVLDNPRVRLVVTDGRNYILLANEQYDYVVADTIYPTQAYSSNLYSIDYYRLLASHLTENGITLQWIDSALPNHEQRILMRTFTHAFRYVLLWDGHGLRLVLGSNAPLQPDLAAIRQAFTPEVAQALAPMGIARAEDIADAFKLSDDELRASLGPGLVISDDHPYNEYFRLLRIGDLWQWLERLPFAAEVTP
jgi:predicted membrane-bound spermidine synthase